MSDEDKTMMSGGEDLGRALVALSDNLPYSAERLQQEVMMLYRMGAVLHYERGRRLIVMWEHERESVRTFGHFVNLYFPDLPLQRAYEDMQFAMKTKDCPLFREYATGKGNWSKVFALTETADPEDIQEFETTGEILGMTRSDLDRLSVRELKALVKKLKKENKEGVAKATAELEKENQGLRSDKEALEAALNGPEVEEGFKIIRKAEEKCLDAVGLLRQVPAALLEREAGLRNLVFGSCEMLRRVIDQLEGEAQGALNRALVEEEVVAGDQ